MNIDATNYTIDCFHSAPLIGGVFKSKGIDRKRHLLQAFLLAIDAPVKIFHGGVGVTILKDKLGFEDNIEL